MDLAFDLDDMIGGFANLTMPSNGCMEDGYCGWLNYCTEAEAKMTTGNDDNITSTAATRPERCVPFIASDEYS